MGLTRDKMSFVGMHHLFYAYNAVVTLLIAAFMSLTQIKIVESAGAKYFLERVSVLPAPAPENFFVTCLSFLLLVAFGRLYTTADTRESWQYVYMFLEVCACIFVMHSINLAYDGVVLVIVADLMRRYAGRNQEYILPAAMTLLYFIANYNLVALKMKVVPFEAYIAYYNGAAQTVLLATKNTLVSLNIVLFVIFIVLLVKSNHEEKERIRQLNARLEDANEQLRLYAQEAERTAETRERNRLAREIHDTLGHTLTGIAAGLDACIMTMETAPEFSKKQLGKIRQMALDGIKDVRRSVKKLRPDALEKLPLRYALAKMTAEFAESSGMDITFDVTGWPDNLRKDEEEVVYRIVQECLTNANRHGRAKHVGITVGGDGEVLRIIIADDGQGAQEIKQGFGLRHMKERLDLLHGSPNYWSDGGFIVEAAIPINKERS